LKHLPYIRTDSDREWRLGYHDTKPIAYVNVDGWGGEGSKLKAFHAMVDHVFKWDNALGPHGQKLDAHVVALTNGWQYGAWLLLDTQAGKLCNLCSFKRLTLAPNRHNYRFLVTRWYQL